MAVRDIFSGLEYAYRLISKLIVKQKMLLEIAISTVM
jgi:hypothetical protein